MLETINITEDMYESKDYQIAKILSLLDQGELNYINTLRYFLTRMSVEDLHDFIALVEPDPDIEEDDFSAELETLLGQLPLINQTPSTNFQF